MTTEEITQLIVGMQARLDACAKSGQAYRVKWSEVKSIIATIKTLQERLAQANDCGLVLEGRLDETCRDLFTRWNTRVRADVATPPLDSIYKAIEDALNSYRMQHTRELPDLDNGLSLLDRLTPDDDRDTTRGREELDLLIDCVSGAVGDVFRSATDADVAPGEEPSVRGVLYQAFLRWLNAHPYVKPVLQQGDVGELTEIQAAALTASPTVVGPTEDAEIEICPVCKDEVPLDSMLSYNNVPNAFCQQCVDSGKV